MRNFRDKGTAAVADRPKTERESEENALPLSEPPVAPEADVAEPERAVIRHYRRCTALIVPGDTVHVHGVHSDSGADGVTVNGARWCKFETKRYPKPRSAEIELEKHALEAHSTAAQKRIVVERKEVDA